MATATRKKAAAAAGPKRVGPPRFATVAEAIETLRPSLPVYALFPKRITRSVRKFMTGFPGARSTPSRRTRPPELLDPDL